jgi:Peptidase family M48.
MSNWIFDEESNAPPVKPGNESLGGVLIAGILALVAGALAHGAVWCLKKIFDKLSGVSKKDNEAMKSAQGFNNDKPRVLFENNMAAIKKIELSWHQKTKEAKLKYLSALLPKGYDEVLPLISDAILSTVEATISTALLCHHCHLDKVKTIIKSSLFVKNPMEIAIGVNSAIMLDHLYRWHFSPSKSENEKVWKGWQQLNDRAYAIYNDIMSANTPEEIAKKVLANQSTIEKLENDADTFEGKYEKIYNNWEGIFIDSDQEYTKRLNSDSQEAVTIISGLLDWKLQHDLVKSEMHYKHISREGVYKLEYDGSDKLAELGESMDSKTNGIIDHLFATLYGIVYVGADIAYPYSNTSHELNDANLDLSHRLASMSSIINKMQKVVRIGVEYFNDTPEEIESRSTGSVETGWIPTDPEDVSVMPIVKPGTEALGTIAAIGIVLAGVYHWSKKYKDLKIRHELKAETETSLRALSKIDHNTGLKANKFPLLNRVYLSDLTDIASKMHKLGEAIIDLYSHLVFKASCGYKLSDDSRRNVESINHELQNIRLRINSLETPNGEFSVHDALQSANGLQVLMKHVAAIQYSFEEFDPQADSDTELASQIEECDADSKTAIGQTLSLYQDYSKLFMQMANDLTTKLQSMFKEIDRLAGKTKPGTEVMTDTTPAVVETAEQEPVWAEQDTSDGWCDFDTHVDPEPAIEMGTDEGVVAADDLQAIAGLESYCDLIQQTGMSRDIYVACESIVPGVLAAINQRHLTQSPSRTGKTVALEALQSHVAAMRTPKPTQVATAVSDAVIDVKFAATAYRPSRASWVLPGMESIDHIRNSNLFSRLTAAVRYMRESKDYTVKNFKQSGFNDAIFEETGMRIQVELDPNTSPNAYVYIPEININNSIMQEWTRNWTTNDSLLDLKKALGRTTEALLDRSTSKVGGVLSNLLIKSCITKGLMTAKEFTCEEIAAVMMHECGHVFTFFERMLDIMSMNYAISAVTSRLLNTEDKKLRMNLIHEFDAAFGVTIPDVELLAETKKGETIATVLISETVRNRRNAEGDMIYSQRGFEFSSDQFATRHGAGAHLVTALDKMMRKYGKDSSYSCWAMHIIKQSTIFLLHIPAVIAGLFLVPILSIILIALLIISRPLNKTYDEIPARFARVRREMIDSLKDQTLPAELRRSILSELETVSNIIDKLEYKRDWLEAVWAHIIPSGRKATSSQELQQLLERLGNNDLWITAAKYKLLSEDLKNA